MSWKSRWYIIQTLVALTTSDPFYNQDCFFEAENHLKRLNGRFHLERNLSKGKEIDNTYARILNIKQPPKVPLNMKNGKYIPTRSIRPRSGPRRIETKHVAATASQPSRHTTVELKSTTSTTIVSKPLHYEGCPLLPYKWNCVLHKHDMGSQNSAEVAQNLKFIPSNNCSLLDIQLNPSFFIQVITGKRLLFFGDSLLLQLLISIACQAFSLLDMSTSKVAWGFPEPCHKGMYECSKLNREKYKVSGLMEVELYFKSGGFIKFFDLRDTRKISDLYRYATHESMDGDVIVLNVGIHGLNIRDITEPIIPLFKAIKDQKSDVKVIWMTTPQPNFLNDDGRGEYKPGVSYGTKPCVLPKIQVSEVDQLKNTTVFLTDRFEPLMDHLSGVLSMDGYGDAHVPEAKVGRGDCAHFCMPGPPDTLANMLFSMMKAFT